MGAHDTDGDTGADTVWLTYAELGKARGTNAAAAKRLAMRRRWRRQAGNDGTTRVSVPVSEAQHWKGDTGMRTDVGTDVNTGVDTPELARVISAFEAAVTSITLRAENAEKRADQAEIRAQSAESRANQAELSLAEAEKRADRLGSELEAANATAEAAQIAQGEAEADAAEMHIQRDAAEARAKRAEQAEQAERKQAAEIRAAWNAERNRAETAEAELRQAEALAQKAEHDRTAAVTIADEAVRAAEELRQAQAGRAGQGRWARLRAAWRGA